MRQKVVITGGYRWDYYMWFLLGFYMLQERGEIDVEFRTPFFSRMMAGPNTRFTSRVWNHFRWKLERDTHNMTGLVEYPDGKKKAFTIDSSDAPYMFSGRLLRDVDAYFKMQCPISLEGDAFPLSPGVEIPWIDSEHVDPSIVEQNARGERKRVDIHPYIGKIHPLMVGPRRLSHGIDKRSLLAGYNNYIESRKVQKEKKVMCYFGNALGPRPENVDVPDYLWEGDVLGYFGNKVSHPNEKRAVAAEHISRGNGNDARVISDAHADSGEGVREDLVIPLERFCEHVSQFQYNFNVSGYCKSIPNRFIESFLVGTGILTDRLSVRWYRPFDPCEVIETVEMGYLPMDQVDWKGFERDLDSLPPSNPGKILNCFEEKWEPSKVARYILDTVDRS